MNNSRISSRNMPSVMEQQEAIAREMQAAAKQKAIQDGNEAGLTGDTPNNLKSRRRAALQRLRERIARGEVSTGSYIDVTEPQIEPEFSPEQMQKIDAEITATIEDAKKKVKAAGAPAELPCPTCGFEAKTKAGLGSHKRKHK